MREFVDSGLIQMGDSGNTPQPIRVQVQSAESNIPVLSQALSEERRGVLPSQSSGQASQSQDNAQQDDVNSL